MAKEIRLYVKQSDLLDVANGSRLLRVHTDISKWERDDVVFITGQEHRRIISFVKEEMLNLLTENVRNSFRKAIGFPLKKLEETREYDVCFEGASVSHTELDPT